MFYNISLRVNQYSPTNTLVGIQLSMLTEETKILVGFQYYLIVYLT